MDREYRLSEWQRHEDHPHARIYRFMHFNNRDVVAAHDPVRNITYLGETYELLSPTQQAAAKRRTAKVTLLKDLCIVLTD